jgi:predicted dehydrogenase
MNFGFIGSEPEWQVVQPAFRLDSLHRLLAAVIEMEVPQRASAPSNSTSIPTLPSPTHRLRDFCELLTFSELDAVILGGRVTERADRLRQIIQLGRHCVCLHPADTSPLFYHEVAMIAQDHGVTLMPWLPARLHPACQALSELCREGTLGALKLITIERFGPMPTGRLLVADSYAEAVDILWVLAGEVAEISSTGDANLGRLVVHHRMNAGAEGEIRLQRSLVTDDCWTVAVDGEHGSAELTFENGLAGAATLRQTDPNETRESEYAAPALANLLLLEFSKAIHRQPHAIKWCDATRAAELADWGWYSLERRRAVDIFHEERGELASFKGRMTSLGCGLIWITLLILIVIAIGKGLNLPGMDFLAEATAIVWLLFLLFQSTRWVLNSEARSDNSS